MTPNPHQTLTNQICHM